MKAKQTSLFALALCAIGVGVAPTSIAQTTFTWGAPTTGTWQNGVAFGAAASYVNNLSASGSIANFGSLSGPTTASVNGTVEAYRLGHFTAQQLTLSVGTGTPLIRLGAGGIGQSSSSAGLIINSGIGIEVTTGQAWNFSAGNTFAGVVSGSGTLAITTGSSRGQTWLNAGNTYSGAITVTAGQLLTTQSTGFQFATLDTTGISTATGFRFSQANNTIGALQGSGNLQLSRKNNAIEGTDRGGMTLTIGNNNTSTTFSGNLTQGASASSIIKTGAGTQTFSGANTYTGTTTVQGGTLLVNGTHTGGGNYSVTSGATLGGTGTIDALVTIGGTSFLAPGASPGVLTVTDLTLQDGATVNFEPGDRTDVTNLLDIDQWTLALTGNDATWAKGGSTVIFNYGSINNNGGANYLLKTNVLFPSLSFNPASDPDIYLYDTGSSIVLMGMYVIPEAETSTLLLGGVLALLAFRRLRHA